MIDDNITLNFPYKNKLIDLLSQYLFFVKNEFEFNNENKCMFSYLVGDSTAKIHQF